MRRRLSKSLETQKNVQGVVQASAGSAHCLRNVQPDTSWLLPGASEILMLSGVRHCMGVA